MFFHLVFILYMGVTFLTRVRKVTKRRRPCPAKPCASSNRPMKRRLMPPCGVANLARVLTIWRLLCASLRFASCLTAWCLLHRPVAAAGARGNSPAYAWATAGSDSPRAFSRPPRRCSARDKG